MKDIVQLDDSFSTWSRCGRPTTNKPVSLRESSRKLKRTASGASVPAPFRKISPRYDLAAFNGPTQRPDVNLPFILGCFLLSTSLRPTSSLSIPSFWPPVRLSCSVISPSASRTSSYNCLLAFFPADAKLCRDACVHRDFASIFAALFSSRSPSLSFSLSYSLSVSYMYVGDERTPETIPLELRENP